MSIIIQKFSNSTNEYLNRDRFFDSQVLTRIKAITLPILEALALAEQVGTLVIPLIKCCIISVRFLRSGSREHLYSLAKEFIVIAQIVVKIVVCAFNIVFAPLLGVVSPKMCLEWHYRCGLAEKALLIEVCEHVDPLQMPEAYPVTKLEKLTGHICGGWFVANSEVEGNNQHSIMSYLHEYLKKHPNLWPSQQVVMSKLAAAIQLDTLIKWRGVSALKRALEQSFETNTPLLISGGWVGNPHGHAIYYEFIPLSSTLHIYNLGAGSESQFQALVGNKIKKFPCVSWEGIPRAHILNETFLRPLVELGQFIQHPDMKFNTDYDASDLYHLVKLFQPVRVRGTITTEEEEPKLLMTGQDEAGICSWRSLMAWLRPQMPKEDYKRFLNDIKIQVLGELFQEQKRREASWLNRFQGSTPSRHKTSRTLIAKSHKNVTLSIESLFKKGVISFSMMSEKVKNLQRVADWLQMKAHPLPTHFIALEFKLAPQFLFPLLKTVERSGNVESSSQSMQSFIFEQTRHLPLDARSLLSSLVTLNQLVSDKWLQEATEVQGMLVQFITRLDTSKDYLISAAQNDPVEAENLMVELGTTCELFFRSCYAIPKYEEIHSECIYCFVKLLSMQKELFLMVNPEELNFYFSRVMSMNSLLDSAPRSIISMLDPKQANELRLWRANWEPDQSKFNGGLGFKNRDGFSIIFTGSPRYIFSYLQKHKPHLLNTIISKTKVVSAPTYVQEAYVFMSDALPASLKILRNSDLYFKFYLEMPVKLVNRLKKEDLKLEFKLRSDANNKSSIVDITIPGLCHNNKSLFRPIEIFRKGEPTVAERTLYNNTPLYGFGLINATEKEQLSRIEEDEEVIQHVSLVRRFYNLQLSNVLAHYRRYPEELRDPTAQVFFARLIFQHGELTRVFGDTSLGNKLVQFLVEQHRKCAKSNTIQVHLFFAQMLRRVLPFLRDNSNQQEKKDFVITALRNLQEELRALLLKSSLEPFEKSLVYAELAASSCHKELLEEQEIAELLSAHTQLKQFSVASEWKEIETEREVKRAMQRHAAQIEGWLVRDHLVQHTHLNSIITALYPEVNLSAQWEVERKKGFTPRFYTLDSSYQFFPFEGLLISNLPVHLPEEILLNVYFKRLFPNVNAASYREGYFYFRDQQGEEARVWFLVNQNGKHLRIEKKLEDARWYLFQDADFSKETTLKNNEKRLTSLFESRYLLNQCDLYLLSDPLNQSEREQLCFFDKKSHQLLYRATFESYLLNQLKSLERVSDGALLSEPNPLFNDFEDPQYVHQWHEKSHQLKEIEFPRYKLSFVLQNEKLVCQQHKDYYLDLTYQMDVLRDYPAKLIMRNEAGKRKVIVTDQQFEAPRKKNTLEAVFKIDRQLGRFEEDPQSYFIFDLTSKGQLHSPSLAANLHLAHIHLLTQHYEEAAYFIKRYGEKLIPYSDKEKEHLRAIVINVARDRDGNGAAIRLYATYLLMKNAHTYASGQMMPESNLTNDYGFYLYRYQKITALKLSQREELFLLNCIPEKEPQFRERLRQITNLNLIGKPSETNNVEKAKIILPNTLHGIIEADMKQIDWSKQLLSRVPLNYGTQDFWNFYREAKEGTPQAKEALKVACLYWKKSEEDDVRRCGHLLEIVNNHAHEFPKAKQDVSVEGILNTARSLAAQQELNPPSEPNVTNLVKPLPNHTPADFKLPDSQLELKPVDSVFSFPTAPSSPVSSNIADLEANQKEYQLRMDQLEQGMMDIVGKLPDDDLVHQAKLLRWGRAHTPPTLEEILMAFGRKDPLFLQRRNPYLTTQETNQLLCSAADYLLLATAQQQCKRALDLIDKTEAAQGEERLALQEELAEELDKRRAYDPAKQFSYLAFEYFANVLMRPDQLMNLATFLESGDQSLIMEMIMGSGKSQILLPLLGLLRADGQSISIVVVLPQFLPSVSSDTQASLMNSFGTSLRVIHFDRSTPLTVESLEIILMDLEGIRTARECLIMTNKSILCLLLRFVENYVAHFANPECVELSAELRLMQKIVALLGEKGLPIQDEGDLINNILQQLCYSIGQPVSPPEYILKVCTDLYLQLYTHSDLKDLVRLESDPEPNLNAPLMTEDYYRAHIRRPFAEIILQNRGWGEAWMIDYVCRSYSPEIQAKYNQLPFEQQQQMALISQQISEFMPHTLAQVCDVNYGLDESTTTLALPFLAAKTPSRGSQFAVYLITINSTIQSYIKKGISRAVIEKEVKRLHSQALHEIDEASQSGLDWDWDQTPSGQIFIKMVEDPNFPFQNIKEKDWKRLHSKINVSRQQQMKFLAEIILPNIQLFLKKIIANPLNGADFFRKLLAFTGTLWNGHSMHTKFKAIHDTGIDAKTDQAIMKHGGEVIIGVEGSTEETLASLSAFNYDLIIDTGGYLKREEDPTQLARKVVLNKGKPVAFYNREGVQSITDGTQEMLLSESPVKIDQRIVVLEMRFTTGANIKYKPTAHGVMTIGRDILWRDLKQGAWRLRGLDRGQKISFFVSRDVETLIRNSSKNHDGQLTYRDIVLFAKKNEAERVKQDNLTALKEGFLAIPQRLVASKMLEDNQLPEMCQRTARLVEELWIKTEEIDPAKLFGQLSEACSVHEYFYSPQGIVAQCHALLDKIYRELEIEVSVRQTVDQSVKELEVTTANYIQQGLLPEVIVKPVINRDMTMETVVEQNTEIQQNMKVEKVQTNFKGIKKLGFVKGEKLKRWDTIPNSRLPSHDEKLPYFSLQNYFADLPLFNQYAEAFSDVYITTNILAWSEELSAPNLEDSQFFWPHRHLKHLLIDQHNELIVLSEDDIQKTGRNGYVNFSSKNYYRMNLGFCNDPDRVVGPELLAKIVKVKFLDGESRYTSDELELLKIWLTKHGAGKMRELYMHALAVSPKRRAAFNSNSPLKNLFKVMMDV